MPPLDPLLIGSFPVPPSHIPTSPNPPLSRPPSLPLPPVPGPSRISTTESLYLLSSTSSSSGTRSRSSSKVSDTSSLDNASLRSGGKSSRPVSPASIRTRAMTPHAGIEFLIQEHNSKNDELLNVDFELQDEADMDPEELLLNRLSPIHLRKGYHHRAANDSISSIDVSDILAATSNLSDDEYHTHMATLRTPQTLSRKQSTIARHRANSGLSLADPIDPQTIFAPSTPTTHSFPSTSPPSSPISPLRIPGKTVKNPVKETIKEKAPQKPPTPPSSPDIPSILASSTKTRPSQRTRVSSNASSSSLGFSQRQRSKSRQRVSSTTSNGSSASAYVGISVSSTGPATRQGNQQGASLNSPAVVPRRLKGSSSSHGHNSRSLSSDSGPLDRRSWIPHDDFGRPIPIPLTESPVPVSRPNSGDTEFSAQWGPDSRIEIEVEALNEGDESGSDDSSIDLHTPLPHYMLKHGLLSPKSKLLQEVSESRNGRESVMSASSSKTGYSNLQDPRNTEKRRRRHRDGKLLKEGVGLTTGLGWSDSEDEDAPSALTRRLSKLNLSRSTSFASLHSMRSMGSLHSSRSFYGKPSRKLQHNPNSYSQSSSVSALSKSFSSGMLYDDGFQEPMPPSLDELDEWGVIDAARFSNNTSTSLTPQADTFGVLSSSPSAPSMLQAPSMPRSQTMPNINSKLRAAGGMPRPSFNRKRSGSGSKSDRLSTSTVGSVNSNASAASGFSGSTSFSGFSTREGIPEEREKDFEEEELMMKTTTSIGPGMKYRAHTMGGRKGYKYSKTPSGGSGSISASISASAMSHSSSTSTSGSGATGLSSSPSTSSSMSIPLPVTPCDDGVFDDVATVMTSSSTTLPGVNPQMAAQTPNKNKMLPPLPPTLRRIPGKKELNLDAGDTFMSTPVSGAKLAAKEEVARSTATPKAGLAFPGASSSLNSRSRTPSNMASGIATPMGRKTPTPAAGARTNGSLTSLPSSMSTPRPLRLASSPHVNSTPTPANHGSKDRAPVPVPSIQSATLPPTSALPRPPPSPLVSNTPQSAPAGSTNFRSLSTSTSGSSIPSSLTPGERKPRTGTGMVYRNSSVGPSKLRLPAVAAANGNLSASVSGIARPARTAGPVAF